MEDTCIFWSNERIESADLLDLCWASLSDMIGLNVVTLLKVVNKLMLQGSEKFCFLLYTVLHPWYTGHLGAFWSWLSLCFYCLFQDCLSSLSSLLQRIFERETWVYSVAGEDGSPAHDIGISCRMQFFCLTQYCTNTTKKPWASDSSNRMLKTNSLSLLQNVLLEQWALMKELLQTKK
jgi:hypothetical protein